MKKVLIKTLFFYKIYNLILDDYNFSKIDHTINARRLFMKTFKYITLIIAIIGAINWGLIGLFDFNLVTALFGVDSALTRIVYILVGISGICILSLFSDISKEK